MRTNKAIGATLVATLLCGLFLPPRCSFASPPLESGPPPGAATTRPALPAASSIQGPDLHVDEFGVTDGQPVTEGFIFFDGQYLEAPYLVSRKGLSVFINDRMIEGPARWPVPQPDPSVGEIDPPLPTGISRETSMYDPRVEEYLGLKKAYLAKRYGLEDAVVRMVGVYRSLPCVREVEQEDARNVAVTWTDGTTERICLFPPTGRAIKHDKESMLARYEAMRQNYEDRLRLGDVYFLSSQGGRITMGRGKAVEILPRLIAILRSSNANDEKFAALHDIGLIGITPTSNAALVTDFRASPQLEDRISEVVQQRHD